MMQDNLKVSCTPNYRLIWDIRGQFVPSWRWKVDQLSVISNSNNLPTKNCEYASSSISIVSQLETKSPNVAKSRWFGKWNCAFLTISVVMQPDARIAFIFRLRLGPWRSTLNGEILEFKRQMLWFSNGRMKYCFSPCANSRKFKARRPPQFPDSQSSS